ncbi:pyridoxamine 5'-phosphate oxidase-domain-containing protein [Staphylotrichum tortipilum]|uniref:Pyridoxamine 5'-phosphate oxidase-domain-containing protein n=1 Tax=Staphylotrichum tortipilum TaxID=2831512 RepID=A0AAN6RRK7_9PEZI|nr:pyridoxamine 5'-phosphate oxidase-domain-containing protein [Staphylotrichum longicolle]
MKPVAAGNALLSCFTVGAAAAAASVPSFDHDLRIPTSYESAVLGRRILALTPLGTLATVFPHAKESDGIAPLERRPPGLDGLPYSLMEYIADCEEDGLGNPTILAITIGTTFKNAAAGSNVSLAVQWTPPHPPAKRIEGKKTKKAKKRSWLSYLGWGDDVKEGHHKHGRHHHDYHSAALPYSAANLPRFSLLGHLEPIEGGDDRDGHVASCYVKSHPDAKYWLPGNRIHQAHFVRLVVDQVYWVGGFGDRAFIGWIPVEEWQRVTREEWQNARLPGEKKGWKEWSVAGDL